LYYVKFPKTNPHTGQKHIRWTETEQWYLAPIHKIERVPYDGLVFNLEADDPDHSCLASFVAVSNCQNHDISQVAAGPEAGPERLAEMMLELQAMGCHNINFVTPEHVAPQILEALPLAIERGLRLPLVCNTSAYDSLESLRFMDGVVDIYMPDFKIWDSRMALKYLLAKDYAEAARRAIAEMHRQVGELNVDEDGLAKRGVLVRHLVMPGDVADVAEIMRFLAREISPHTYVNIMAQYYPENRVTAEKFGEINRRITKQELARAFDAARAAGLYRFDERRPRIRWF
jgi:putative pyruvate formate lyase activating enzyme